jgi:hypothetical protein
MFGVSFAIDGRRADGRARKRVHGPRQPVGLMNLLTSGEFFLLLHLGLGIAFIHGFAGGIATLVDRATTRFAETRLKARVRAASTLLMAGALWGAVISGTWLVYPGYRAEPPDGAATTSYPKADLLAREHLAFWHDFGMEWKEHVAWLTPFLATAIAFVAIRYGRRVSRDKRIRRSLIRLFTVAALASVVAAGLGAAINKVAPNLFLDL